MINHWLKCAPALHHNETHWLLLIILASFPASTTEHDIAPIMGRTTRHVWNQLEPMIEAGFVERLEGEGRSCNGRRHRKAYFQLTAKAKALINSTTEALA